MNRLSITFAFSALAIFTPIHPGVAGDFLCNSANPYEYHEVVSANANTADISLTGDLVTQSRIGNPYGTPAKTVAGTDGFVIFNTHSDEAIAAEIHYQGKPIQLIKGTVSDADIHRGSRPIVLLTTHDPEAVRNGRVSANQMVIDSRGAVVASRKLDVHLGEDFPQYRFTGDGDGIYRVATGMTPIDSIEVLDSRTFRTVSSISFNDYGFLKVVMQSPLSGFAIGESGQLFRFASGRIIPIEAGDSVFHANDIQNDPRSNRILVSGRGGYRVFDPSGRLLFAKDGFRTGGVAYVPDARLAIDGSVAVRDPENGKYVARINDHGNYARMVELPLSREEWRNIACFTPNSAALIDSSGNPQLVDFRKRR